MLHNFLKSDFFFSFQIKYIGLNHKVLVYDSWTKHKVRMNLVTVSGFELMKYDQETQSIFWFFRYKFFQLVKEWQYRSIMQFLIPKQRNKAFFQLL